MKAKTKRFLVVSALGLTAFACSESKNNVSRDLAVLGLLSGSEQKISEPTDLQRKAIEVGKEMGSSIQKSETDSVSFDLKGRLTELYSWATDSEKKDLKTQMLKNARENGREGDAQNLVNKPDQDFMASLFELHLKDKSNSQSGLHIDGKARTTRGWAGGWQCRIIGFGTFYLGYDYWPALFVCGFFGGTLSGFDAPNHCITSGWIWGCN